MNTTAPKLPRNANDGDEILDKFGNKWVYNAAQNNWISKGTVAVAPIVSEENDGLITPEIYSHLRQLEAYKKSNPNPKSLKLLPGSDAYWYYLRSGDKCFKFRQEGQNALRIEVDKGRIFQILMKKTCPGLTGEKGDRGDQGTPVIPGAPELCYQPHIEGNRLDFAIFTPTPLLSDTPVPLPNNHIPDISVRVYQTNIASNAVDQLYYMPIWLNQNSKASLENFDIIKQQFDSSTGTNNICGLELSPVITSRPTQDPIISYYINPEDPTITHIDSTIPIDDIRTYIKFDIETGLVCGSIYLSESNWSDIAGSFCVKSRQMGPDGYTGDPGESRIRVVEQNVDTTSIRATCPIIHARYSLEQETLFILCSDLLSEICVDKIRLVPGSNTLANTNALKSTFAAAKMTLDNCKDIGRFGPDDLRNLLIPEDFEVPELDLMHWDPQPGCFTQRHFDRHKFDWIRGTDTPACDDRGTWYGPDNVRTGKYPFEFITANEPDKNHCCIAAGTLIHTVNGLKRIEDFSDGEMVLCPDGEFRKIDEFFDNGVKECVEVLFDDGVSLITTPDHKFIVNSTLVEAKDLNVGDEVPAVCGSLEHIKSYNHGTSADFEIGYIIGYVFSDNCGWITNSIGLTPTYPDVFDRCYEFLSSKFGSNNSGVWDTIYFKELGYKKDADDINIPLLIYQQSFEFYRGFFLSILSSNGLRSSSKELPLVCKNIFDYLGFASSLIERDGWVVDCNVSFVMKELQIECLELFL